MIERVLSSFLVNRLEKVFSENDFGLGLSSNVEDTSRGIKVMRIPQMMT